MHLTSILAISIAIAVVAANQNDLTKTKKIVCPVNTKSMYDASISEFTIENVDLNLCTHIVCIDQYWNDAEDPWETDDPNRYDDYKQLTDLRSKYAHLKVLLGIRGNNVNYMEAVKDDKFIENVANFLSKYEFDGLDLRWTYSSGEDAIFIAKLKSLFKGLKSKLRESNRLFTSSCEILPDSDIDNINESGIFKVPDFIALFNSYSNVKNERDAINARSFTNVTEYIDDLFRIFNSHDEIEQYKIIIGFPLDSPEFITKENESKLSRFVDYNTICGLLSTENWQKSFDDECGLAIAKSQTNEHGENTLIVFESSRSIANKMNYAMSRSLGGAMISLLHKDDIDGKCGFEADTWTDFKPKNGKTINIPKRNDSRLTLLRTINESYKIYAEKKNPSNSSYNKFNAMVLFIGIFICLLF